MRSRSRPRLQSVRNCIIIYSCKSYYRPIQVLIITAGLISIVGNKVSVRQMILSDGSSDIRRPLRCHGYFPLPSPSHSHHHTTNDRQVQPNRICSTISLQTFFCHWNSIVNNIVMEWWSLRTAENDIYYHNKVVIHR